MRIAIIGVGNVGSALARAFRTAGHAVVVSSHHASHAEKIAEELDVSAASSNRAAVENAELVVLAVPAKAVASVLEETAEFLHDTIVVDSTNPADEDAETILRASASSADAVVLLAPGARVVKAFNPTGGSLRSTPVVTTARHKI
jgi:predicted dinucleotide-binding enzyme